MAYEEDKEVDWSGLVAVGSLLGNLLQYTEKNNLEKTLHWTGERLRAIAEDRRRDDVLFTVVGSAKGESAQLDTQKQDPLPRHRPGDRRGTG